MNTIQGFNGYYRFLSNFYPTQIEFESIKYPTVEHAYQAAKTKDDIVRLYIASIPTPVKAKQFGRQILLRDDWEDIKLSIMETLLRKKFYDPILKAALLHTGDSQLIEMNYWHDQFWGNCTCKQHQMLDGLNNLGKLLMNIRDNQR